MQLSNVTGAPVIGDDFYDREREQRHLWRRLETDSVLLLAPRRVGKTSLLLRLVATSEQHGFEAVYTSVSYHQTELELCEALITALARHPVGHALIAKLAKKSMLSRFFERFEEVDLKLASFKLSHRDDASWNDIAAALAGALATHTNRWLIVVDELPIFVNRLVAVDPRRASTFLTWFRQLRLDLGGEGLVRWVLAGSIGLDTVAKRYGLGETINDLAVMGLGAFEVDAADAFLETLGRSYAFDLTPELRADVIRRVGWPVPYFLQIFFADLYAWCDDHGVPPTPAALDAVYQRLLAPEHKAYFDPWVQRLPKTFGAADAALARQLLTIVANDPAGAPRAVLRTAFADRAPDAEDGRFTFLLDALQSDGYVVEADRGAYYFRSPLLREYWRRRVVD